MPSCLGCFNIDIPSIIFESKKVRPTTGQPVPTSSDSYIVPWKQAIFLVDPRVRNFVNENILKRRVRLELKKEDGTKLV